MAIQTDLALMLCGPMLAFLFMALSLVDCSFVGP